MEHDEPIDGPTLNDLVEANALNAALGLLDRLDLSAHERRYAVALVDTMMASLPGFYAAYPMRVVNAALAATLAAADEAERIITLRDYQPHKKGK